MKVNHLLVCPHEAKVRVMQEKNCSGKVFFCARCTTMGTIRYRAAGCSAASLASFTLPATGMTHRAAAGGSSAASLVSSAPRRKLCLHLPQKVTSHSATSLASIALGGELLAANQAATHTRR